ncbi:hypothetical protein [Flavobacterium sp. MK4S-17]|uniref:hypothetical protein n=1 Tax=Flavobacterium sp. MK4S-17 TaxID=2543737 RepID=UPI00135A60D3|nr:hypothetical protein [Flavobacterium sp. MK4S-17]
MKKVVLLFIILSTYIGFAQKTSNMFFELSFVMETAQFKKAEIYLLCSKGAVSVWECNYSSEKISPIHTKVKLQGNYKYIVGPPGFLATICITKPHKNSFGLEITENYFIRLDDTIEINNNSVTADLGTIELNYSYPFIYVQNLNGKLVPKRNLSPKSWDRNLLSEMLKWTRVKKAE